MQDSGNECRKMQSWQSRNKKWLQMLEEMQERERSAAGDTEAARENV